jgi:cysteine desulfurase
MIYLDYNATTPIDPQVQQAMVPFLTERFGNPSSGYECGRRAKEGVAKARAQVASLIRARPDEVVFTSGGTESDNHAIIGTMLANQDRGNHVITSAIEHPAVLNTCRYMEERFGIQVTRLPVDGHGLVDPDEVGKAITPRTVLVTIMHSNNEVGTIEPIEEIGRVTHERGVPFHTDAAQSCGKVPVNVNQLNVDLLTIAGHKLYAPKGIGALYIRKGMIIDPYVHGAGQEQGRRAGTENVPYIVGLGAACEIAGNSVAGYQETIQRLRDMLFNLLESGLGEDNVRLNGHPGKRLPNTLNISMKGIIGAELLAQIPEISASAGAACHSGSTEPSSVLLAMGISRERALGALRLTLGRWSNEREVITAAGLLIEKAKQCVSGWV